MALNSISLAVLEHAEGHVDTTVSHLTELRRALPPAIRNDTTMRALAAVAASAVRAELMKRLKEIDS